MTTIVVHEITIPAYHAHRGGKNVQVAARTARVQFAIDLEGIYRRIGAQAMQNQSGKAIALHRLITAKVLP